MTSNVRRWGYLVLAGFCLPLSTLLSQNPKLAPADLAYSREYAAQHHLIVQVTCEMSPDETIQFQYEQFPEMTRITDDTAAQYVRRGGRTWERWSDADKTGNAVQVSMVAQLDTYAEIAEIPWAEHTNQDKSQGANVWKLVGRTQTYHAEHVTYECTRVKPKRDGSYPKFTFVQYAGDPDGKLLLEHFSGLVRTDTDAWPVEIQFGYAPPLYANSLDLPNYEVWITGEVFTKGNTLLFRADRPVQNNKAGNVVLLGVTKNAQALLPAYVKAAEKHARLRLYGVLMPIDGTSAEGSPSVQFFTWKLHAPNDPDELPPDKKIILPEREEAPSSPSE